MKPDITRFINKKQIQPDLQIQAYITRSRCETRNNKIYTLKKKYNQMYRLETMDITRFKDMKPDLTRCIHKKTIYNQIHRLKTRFNKIYT